MADIVKAIEKEKDYLAYKMQGQEPFHLIDAIKKCGFKSLNEYFSAKSEFEFSQAAFKYIERQPVECISEVLNMIDTKTQGVLFVDSNETFVFNGTANYNKQYCNDHNIPVYPIYTGGGTIVSTSTDFSVGICYKNCLHVNSQYMLENIKTILQKYTTDELTINGNDILVDSKKVLGSACYAYNDMFMFVAHVSFSDKSELISNICITDKVGKEVGFINFITREEFKQEVRAWLQV